MASTLDIISSCKYNDNNKVKKWSCVTFWCYVMTPGHKNYNIFEITKPKKQNKRLSVYSTSRDKCSMSLTSWRDVIMRIRNRQINHLYFTCRFEFSTSDCIKKWEIASRDEWMNVGLEKHEYSRWNCSVILFTGWDISITTLRKVILSFLSEISLVTSGDVRPRSLASAPASTSWAVASASVSWVLASRLLDVYCRNGTEVNQ